MCLSFVGLRYTIYVLNLINASTPYFNFAYPVCYCILLENAASGGVSFFKTLVL